MAHLRVEMNGYDEIRSGGMVEWLHVGVRFVDVA